MKDKYFIDTNIFVYSFDDASRSKQKKARKLIEQALATGRGVVSYQVIQEFINVSLNRFKKPKHFINFITQLEAYKNEFHKLPHEGVHAEFSLRAAFPGLPGEKKAKADAHH